MFNFASSSLSSYVPLVLFERYLYPVLLPAAILVAGFLAPLFDASHPSPAVRRERRFWGVLAVAVLLLVGSYKHYANRKWYAGWVAEVRTLSRVLQPTDRIHTDILSIHGLEFFWSYPARMNTFNFEDVGAGGGLRSGDYVLVNASYLDWLVDKSGWWPTKRERYVKPDFVAAAPATWDRTWTNGNATLYRIR
jgi:hypothetical protein